MGKSCGFFNKPKAREDKKRKEGMAEKEKEIKKIAKKVLTKQKKCDIIFERRKGCIYVAG